MSIRNKSDLFAKAKTTFPQTQIIWSFHNEVSDTIMESTKGNSPNFNPRHWLWCSFGGQLCCICHARCLRKGHSKEFNHCATMLLYHEAWNSFARSLVSYAHPCLGLHRVEIGEYTHLLHSLEWKCCRVATSGLALTTIIYLSLHSNFKGWARKTETNKCHFQSPRGPQIAWYLGRRAGSTAALRGCRFFNHSGDSLKGQSRTESLNTHLQATFSICVSVRQHALSWRKWCCLRQGTFMYILCE